MGMNQQNVTLSWFVVHQSPWTTSIETFPEQTMNWFVGSFGNISSIRPLKKCVSCNNIPSLMDTWNDCTARVTNTQLSELPLWPSKTSSPIWNLMVGKSPYRQFIRSPNIPPWFQPSPFAKPFQTSHYGGPPKWYYFHKSLWGAFLLIATYPANTIP